MKVQKTYIKGLLIIKLDKHKDKRGNLVKILDKKNSKKFKNKCYESYITTSKKGSVRGLHGQSGKYSQDKIIYCLNGKLIDIVIDIRKNSKTFGKIYTKILKEEDALAIFIPKGFLHGYVSLKRKTIIVNYSSSAYNQKKEVGVNVNSLPIKLPKIKLIYSKKDKELPSYKNLINK
tara:strand:- start:17401 stop:17928 length:528 start_codon:yes stop_codon:yes gene_type:complete